MREAGLIGTRFGMSPLAILALPVEDALILQAAAIAANEAEVKAEKEAAARARRSR